MLSTGDQFNQGNGRRKVFRFEAKWSLEEDREKTIRQAWQSQVPTPNYWAKIHSKLALCSGVLIRWSFKKA